MADVTMDITSNGSLQTAELDALVIGAGFAGLCQLLCLRDRLGLSVKALETGGGLARSAAAQQYRSVQSNHAAGRQGLNLGLAVTDL